MKFRFSLSKFMENSLIGYYNYYYSKCGARGKIQFNFNNINNLDFKILKILS